MSRFFLGITGLTCVFIPLGIFLNSIFLWKEVQIHGGHVLILILMFIIGVVLLENLSKKFSKGNVGNKSSKKPEKTPGGPCGGGDF